MMDSSEKKQKNKRETLIIGWTENVGLPDLGLTRIRAKIDTGARTSALHATDISILNRDGVQWVQFQVEPDENEAAVWVETPVHDVRDIKNTSGIPEERIIIRTRFMIAGHEWDIDLSLTDRSSMRFPMIVGRTALKHHNVAVHTRRAHLTSKKTG